MGILANELFTTGNHVVIYATGDDPLTGIALGFGVVGQKMAGGTDLAVNQDMGAQHVHVIGDAEPQDIVDTRHAYEVTLSSLHLRDDFARDRVNAGRVDIHAIDRFGEIGVRKAVGCQLASANDRIPANQLMATNMRFLALRVV